MQNDREKQQRKEIQSKENIRYIEGDKILFAYIKGILETKTGDTAVIETGGIGYKVGIPLSTYRDLGREGEEAKLHIHTHIREDALALYGFLTREELGMFELLISVSGVGPKAAMSVVSALTPSDFALALITEDTARFKKAPGIGTKIAQRIVLELKDKIRKEQLASNAGMAQPLAAADDRSAIAEAISALMVLGYSQSDAAKAVMSVQEIESDAEALIKGALKNMMRK